MRFSIISKNNVKDICDDLVLMASGEKIRASMQEYAAMAMGLNTKDQIYSAMVVYGLLTYDHAAGEVLIPNRELMDKIQCVFDIIPNCFE